jgi:tRNA(His) guanylyltransferase
MAFEKDSLGSRMKDHESRFQTYLPRRNWTICRLDGRSFHNYLRGCQQPFDARFTNDMDATAMFLCKEIMGAVFSFQFSDEISLLITDFDSIKTESFFNGNVQKMVSVSASMATAYLNSLRYGSVSEELATFDSRVFQISDPVEIANYMVWRETEAERNSLGSLARSYYAHGELHSKNGSELHDLIHAKNDNWNNYPARYKRGGMTIYKDEKWQTIEAPIFKQEPEFLKNLIPTHGY